MLKTAQNNSETNKFHHFEVLQNVGYTPATSGLENCSFRHWSVCRIARWYLNMPITLVICCCYDYGIFLAGRPIPQQETILSFVVAVTCCFDTAFHAKYRPYRPRSYSIFVLQNFSD